MSLKIIYIEWIDAESYDKWCDVTELDEPMPVIKTVGWFIKKTSECYVVSLNMDTKNDFVSCTIKIPKAWVKNLRFLDI